MRNKTHKINVTDEEVLLWKDSKSRSKVANNNTLGYRGTKKTPQGSYIAQIKVSDKRIHIGTYKTVEQAGIAYDKYIIKHNLEHTKNFT